MKDEPLTWDFELLEEYPWGLEIDYVFKDYSEYILWKYGYVHKTPLNNSSSNR